MILYKYIDVSRDQTYIDKHLNSLLKLGWMPVREIPSEAHGVIFLLMKEFPDNYKPMEIEEELNISNKIKKK